MSRRCTCGRGTRCPRSCTAYRTTASQVCAPAHAREDTAPPAVAPETPLPAPAPANPRERDLADNAAYAARMSRLNDELRAARVPKPRRPEPVQVHGVNFNPFDGNDK